MKGALRVKLLLIGESSVGKSSLASQYVEERFEESHKATVGVEFKQKHVSLDDETKLCIQLWDTAGTERFHTITPNFYREVDGILIVFDITDRTSFERLHFWLNEVAEKTNLAKTGITLLGNKIDLEHLRKVQRKEAEQVARDIGIDYSETSAKSFEQTRDALDKLVMRVALNKLKTEKAATNLK